MRSQACLIVSIADRIQPRAGVVATLVVKFDAVTDEGGGLADRGGTRSRSCADPPISPQTFPAIPALPPCPR